MPKKLLNKIIRQIDAEELAGFTLDRRSGELCYLDKEKARTLKIPAPMCRDFFAAVEKFLAEKGKNTSQRFRLLTPKGRVSIALNSRTENGSQKISAEIERPEKLLGFKGLGFTPEQQKKIKNILARKKGLIVVGIPAGEGLSNTIYSLAAEINLETRSAYLLAAAKEYSLRGLNFISLDYPTEEDLRTKLDWLDKKDAEVIIVPEVYERQTALDVAQMANRGHLVLAGCRSRDSFSVLNSFLKASSASEILANFSLIISGRRARRLCPHCVEKYQTSREEISALAKRFAWKTREAEALMPKKLLRSVGCPICNYHGHAGKIGLYEILALDQELKAEKDILAMRNLAFEKGYRPLVLGALEAAKNGLLSLREILSLKI